jgi:hypothetical protein
MENQFKKFSEMSEEEIRDLEHCTFNLYQVARKKQKGVYNYSATVKVRNGLSIMFQLTQDEFYRILTKFNKRPGLAYYTGLQGRMRNSIGHKKDDTEYIFGEFLLAPGMYKSTLYTDGQVEQIHEMYKDLKLEDRPVPVTDDEVFGIVGDPEVN